MLRLLICTLLLILPLAVTHADEEVSAKNIVDGQKLSEEIASQGPGSVSRNPDDRSTPRISAVNLTRYIDADNYAKAGEFLDVRFLPADMQGADPELVSQIVGGALQRHSVEATGFADAGFASSPTVSFGGNVVTVAMRVRNRNAEKQPFAF